MNADSSITPEPVDDRCIGCGRTGAVARFGSLGDEADALPVLLCFRCHIKVPAEQRWAFYRLLLKGHSANMAQLQLLGAPHGSSPKRWGSDRPLGAAQFAASPPEVMAEYTAPAIAAGVHIEGRRYFSELAEYPGDPQAWVADRDEAKQLVESRGWNSPDLGVKDDGHRVDPVGRPVDPSLVVEETVAAFQAEGRDSVKLGEFRDRRAELIKHHSGGGGA